MIDQIQLTQIEEKLIGKVASIQIKSLRDIYDTGHPEIEDFLKEYGEAYECGDVEATLELNEVMDTYCGVKMKPQLILKTGKVFLIAAIFILSHENWIPMHRYQNARKNLCKKLLKVIELNDDININ